MLLVAVIMVGAQMAHAQKPKGLRMMLKDGTSVTQALSTIDSVIFVDMADTVLDIDGNAYTMVTIGTQIWMAENLKTTRYNDGTAIPLVTDAAAWAGLTTPGYCWYNNDSTMYRPTAYGALYNWYAVNTGKLAPTGWHVPTVAEWTTLTTYLGGDTIAGGKMKEAGTTHWYSPNVGATNETGFSALPCGGRAYNGTFMNISLYGNWWSASVSDALNSWNGGLYYNAVYFGLDDLYNTYGFSIRCVKDAP